MKNVTTAIAAASRAARRTKAVRVNATPALLAAAVSCTGLTVPAGAATINLSYVGVETSTSSTFAAGTVTAWAAGSPVRLTNTAATTYLRFSVQAAVTNNPNPAATSGYLIDTNGDGVGDRAQPATLGLGAFGTYLTNSMPSIKPVGADGGGATVSNNSLFLLFSPGTIDAASGTIGQAGTPSSYLAAGTISSIVSPSNPANFPKLTIGASSTATDNRLFNNLEFTIPAGFSGAGVLTPTFDTSSLTVVTNVSPGNASTAPTYNNRNFSAGTDSLTPPGGLTITTLVPLTLSTSDAIGQSSFTAALHWDKSVAPSATYDCYVNAGLTLRTPGDSPSNTFAGRSLTIGNNGASVGSLILKNANNASVTINNLTLNKGRIQNGGTSTAAATTDNLFGNAITVDTGGGTLDSGAAGRTLAVNNPLTGSGPLTVTGGGTVLLRGSNTFAGETTVNGGTRLQAEGVAIPALLNNAGVDLVGTSARLELNYLTAATNPAATVRSILAAGYALPSRFSTSRLRSSTLAAGQALGYRDTGGTAGTVSVRVTLLGDADLDGGVSINDFNALAANFGQASGKVWVEGDFDYDGGVSINDFNLLAGNFGQTLPASGEAWAGLLAFAAAHDDLTAFEAVTGVPEPTTVAVSGGLIAALVRRRRKTALPAR